MKKTEVRTETYSMGGGFYIDISFGDYTEAYIYHKDECFKMFMFGMKCLESTFIECVKNEFKRYKILYLETIAKIEESGLL